VVVTERDKPPLQRPSQKLRSTCTDSGLFLRCPTGEGALRQSPRPRQSVVAHPPFRHTFPSCHCQVETRQKTLLDLFPRKTVSVISPHVSEAGDDGPSNHQTEVLTTTTSGAEGFEETTTYKIDLREYLAHSSESRLL
jgi:hypothetical protein